MGESTLADLTSAELATLPDADLVARAASAVSARVRGLEPEAQAEAIRALSHDQAALFGFWVLHAHGGRGLSGFCQEMPHRAGDPDFWTLLEAALGRLGDHDLLALVRRVPSSMADPDAMLSLDAEYRQLASRSLARVARHIRAHPQEFVTVAPNRPVHQ